MDAPNVRRRAVSLTIILLLYFIFDSSPTPETSNKEIERAIIVENAAWHVLNSSSYGDFDPPNRRWLNLTGFNNESATDWRRLPAVQAKVRQQVVHAVGAEHSNAIISGQIPTTSPLQFYHNATGEVKGSWQRVKDDSTLPAEALGAELAAKENLPHRTLHHNITGDSGTLQLKFIEAGPPDEWHGLNIRGLRARLMVQGEGMADSFRMILTGMHIIETGSILLATHNDNFPALFGMPHLALSERPFLAIQHRLNRTLKDVIDLQASRQLKSTAPWSPPSESLERRHCNLLMYIQQYSLPLQYMVEDVEHELRHPRGAPGIDMSPLPLQMNMVSFSPNCGYVIESTDNVGTPSIGTTLKHHLLGDKEEVYNNRIRKHSLVFAVILLLQTCSIIRQTKDASTTSMKNRISVKTMLILNIADGLVALSFVPTVALTDSLFTPMATVSFMAVLCGIFFNLPFLASIWAVQYEEALRERRQQRSASDTTESNATARQIPIITAAGLDSLPLPVTSGPAATVIGADGGELDMDEMNPSEPQYIVQSRLIFITVSLWLISIWMTTTSSFVQQAYFFILSTIHVSCWIPQIVRNAMRNCRKALRLDFVISQSILRLGPLLYFYGYSNNLADNEPSFWKAMFLIGLAWAQVCILAGQYIFGPRLLVPKSWLPPAYDYHPILREDDESTRIILDHASSPTSPTFKHSHVQSTGAEVKDSKMKRVFDCAICMQGVEVPIVPNQSSASRDGQKHESISQTSFLWRRSYMITPCRHVFHTKCLEMAMRFRLQCPLCREGLPPL